MSLLTGLYGMISSGLDGRCAVYCCCVPPLEEIIRTDLFAVLYSCIKKSRHNGNGEKGPRGRRQGVMERHILPSGSSDASSSGLLDKGWMEMDYGVRVFRRGGFINGSTWGFWKGKRLDGIFVCAGSSCQEDTGDVYLLTWRGEG